MATRGYSRLYWDTIDSLLDKGATLATIGLFTVLLRHADSLGMCFPSYQYIVKITGCSKPFLVKHMALLEAYGVVARVQKERSVTFYTIMNYTKMFDDGPVDTNKVSRLPDKAFQR